MPTVNIYDPDPKIGAKSKLADVLALHAREMGLPATYVLTSPLDAAEILTSDWFPVEIRSRSYIARYTFVAGRDEGHDGKA